MEVVKLLNKAEEQIHNGEFNVDLPLFRSHIQLKQLPSSQRHGKHEEALRNCERAVELRLAANNDNGGLRCIPQGCTPHPCQGIIAPHGLRRGRLPLGSTWKYHTKPRATSYKLSRIFSLSDDMMILLDRDFKACN